MTEAQQPLPGIPWFNIPDPNSPALDELAKRLHLHELQIEDCRHRPQHAKTEEYGRYIFSILKHVQQAGDELDFDDLDIFLGKDFLITVHRRDCAAIRKVQQVAQQNQITRLDQLFYRLVDAAVDDYVPVLDNIGEHARYVESELLKHPDQTMLRNIFHMKSARRSRNMFRKSSSHQREELTLHQGLGARFRRGSMDGAAKSTKNLVVGNTMSSMSLGVR